MSKMAAALLTGLWVVTITIAQDLTITSFNNGYVSWNNVDSNLYYTVEYRPNLSDTNLAWDGSYRACQDVQSTNAIVTVPVGFFYRVVGSTSPMFYSAAVSQTGQTNSDQTGDDGAFQKGVEWPNPRFTIQADTNCVLDNLTGLIWARNADMGSTMIWSNALAYCETLTYGGQNDWRLPNVKELLSLIDYRWHDPGICDTIGTSQGTNNDPFVNVRAQWYWSSTTRADTPNAYFVYMSYGNVGNAVKTSYYGYVWPVRGGQ